MKTLRHAIAMAGSLMVAAHAGATPPAIKAAGEPAPYEDKVLGDMGGARSKMADAGVEVSLDYSGEVWGGLHGGAKRTETYLDLITLGAQLDGEKLFGIKGNKMAVTVIRSDGAHPNTSSVGSLQGISNSEVAVNGTRLFEAWVDQSFLDDRLSVLFGLYDMNSEFQVTSMSDNFLKPSMQIGQSFAQSGRAGPSSFPTTSLAARVKVVPAKDSYALFAVYDGVPGDADHPRSNPVNLQDKDGLLLMAELGYAPEDVPNKLAIGVWDYTAGLDDLTDLDGSGNPAKSQSQGIYVLSSYQFYHDKADRALGAFLRGGVSDGDTAQTDWDAELGLVAGGWVPSRPEGEFGLGLSYAHNADKYMQAQATAGTPTQHSEYSYELYYRDTLAHGINLQPDLQYIVNPATDPAIDDATILGMRMDVSF